MKKIVLVSNASWTMVKFRFGLMAKLKELNYEVIVISPKDDYSSEIEQIGCRFIDIEIDNKGINPFKDLKLIYNLFKIYKQLQADLVIHYTVKPNIYGSTAALLTKTKCFSVIPGLGYAFINENLTAKIVKLLYKLALKIPKVVWFINNDDKAVFLKSKLVDSKKVGMINGEGINTEYYKPFEKKQVTENKDFSFLMISRILEDKGVYEYVEAAKILRAKYQDIKFQLLGPIYLLNPSSISKESVYGWHNDGIIEYLGESKDVRSFISNSDCVVLPSYREGKGMTLVEGASMAKPLIATDVPGCRDVVDDKVSGFLCEVKNAKDLASKMENLYNLSSEERELMGREGRAKMMKELDENIVINKYLIKIKKILK
jgi:glycosyltransferase involved in cell wall biosynthesis